ncbi:MAG: hypothetical protein WCH34_01795 [Bacteroidota bacterium]
MKTTKKKSKTTKNTSKLRNGVSANGKNQKTGKVAKKSQLIILLVTTRYTLVTLNMPTNYGGRLQYCTKIHDMMVLSTWFPTPAPTLASYLLLITAYRKANEDVQAKVANAESVFNTAWEKLNIATKLLRSYVQTICDNNIPNAVEIATSAGMSVKSQGSIDVQNFSVKSLAGGKVQLRAKILNSRSAHEWQCSLDPTDNSKWYVKIIDTTLQGKTIASDFAPKSLVYFRHRTILTDGPTEWDEIISVVIMK